MNFDTAYGNWLQTYQAERNFKMDYALLVNKMRLLAGILKTQLTSSDEADLMNGTAPKHFCTILDKSWHHTYDTIVMEWIKGENIRKDNLIRAEKLARFYLFDYMGTLPQEKFLDSNLFKGDYIMDMTPEEIMASKICIFYSIDLDQVLDMADKFTKVMDTPQLISLGLVGQMLEYGNIESYLDTFRPDLQMIMDYKYKLIQAFK